MATVIAGVTTSLDGFVADPDGSASALYPDLADLRGTDYMNAAIASTGAVLMGGARSRYATPTRMSTSTSSRCPLPGRQRGGSNMIDVVDE
jgi:hypothetical protein